MQDLLEQFYKLPLLFSFAYICILQLILTYFFNLTFFTEEFYFNSLGSHLSYEQIIDTWESQNKLYSLNYIFLPVLLVLKIGIIASALFTIFYLNGFFSVSLQRSFKIALLSESIFLLATFLQIMFLEDIGGINDIYLSYPLSLINFFQPEYIPQEWIYPISLINVFELLYILCLSFGIKQVSQGELSFQRSFLLTSLAYVGILFFWAVLVMFFTLNFNIL